MKITQVFPSGKNYYYCYYYCCCSVEQKDQNANTKEESYLRPSSDTERFMSRT